MKRLLVTLSLLAAATFLVSCEKKFTLEDNIVGTWSISDVEAEIENPSDPALAVQAKAQIAAAAVVLKSAGAGLVFSEDRSFSMNIDLGLIGGIGGGEIEEVPDVDLSKMKGEYILDGDKVHLLMEVSGIKVEIMVLELRDRSLYCVLDMSASEEVPQTFTKYSIALYFSK